MSYTPDPFWYSQGCVFTSDVLQSQWLKHGWLFTHNGLLVPINWAPGEFDYFWTTAVHGCSDFRARDIAQQIYWHKLYDNYSERNEWLANYDAIVEFYNQRFEEAKWGKKKQDQEEELTTTPAATTKDEDLPVCEKVVSDDKNKCTKVTDDKTKEQNIADTVADKDGDVKEEVKEIVVAQLGDKDDSSSDTGNTITDKQQEASTAETTPEQLPKAAKTTLVSPESDPVELGSSTSVKTTRTRKVPKVKPLKNREKRSAKKAAKKAALNNLEDQSKMFKLSKLGR